MKKYILILINLLLLSGLADAQQDFAQWREKVDGYYQVLEKSNLKNFSCMISSNFYIGFLQQNNIDSTHYYPLKFVWIRNGQKY